MKKLDKLARLLNDDFRNHLHAAMEAKFDSLKVQTEYNWGVGALVTTRVDGEDFTPEQFAFLAAWSDGYGKALNLVREEAR